MLFLILKKHHDVLKPFLILFNTMPDTIYNIEGNDLKSSNINMDMTIVDILRKI